MRVQPADILISVLGGPEQRTLWHCTRFLIYRNCEIIKYVLFQATTFVVIPYTNELPQITNEPYNG